jgi:hypothetical protein
MKLNIYTIFDTKTAIYNYPFFQHSDGEATRTFGDLCNDENTRIGQHPEDYHLYRIGTWNDKTAEITQDDHQEIIAKGNELMAQLENVVNIKQGGTD